MSAQEQGEAPVCRAVIAAAGWGKTQACAAASLTGTRVSAATLLTGPDLVAGHLDRDGTATASSPLVIEDLHELSRAEQHRLADLIASVRRRTPVQLTSRSPLDLRVRSALGPSLVELGPQDLALDEAAVHRVLVAHGRDDRDLAALLLDVCAGWPALVCLAADTARSTGLTRRPLLDALTRPAGVLASYLAEQVLPSLSSEQRALLNRLRLLAPLTPELVDAVDHARPSRGAEPGMGGPPCLVGGGRGSRWGPALDVLVRVGLVGPGVRTSDLRVVPVVAAVLAATAAPRTRQDVVLLTTASAWYAAHGRPRAAARALLDAGDADGAAGVVARWAPEILGGGGAADVVAVLASRPLGDLPAGLRLVLGEAARMSGDLVAAGRVLTGMLPPEPGVGLDPALVWRLAALHYSRAEYADALRVARTPLLAGTDRRWHLDAARVLAGRACSRFMLGDPDAGEDARQALEIADRLDDDSVVAHAHVAGALTSTGARRDNHLAAALAAAERGGDLVMACRVLLNQADNRLCAADYARALEIGLAAVDLAEDVAPPGCRVSAFNTVGESLTPLGRFGEARGWFERSLAFSRRCGLSRTSGALHGLAEIDFQQGHAGPALAGYEEVVSLARDTGEHQVLVPALARLSLLVLGETGDAVRAAALAEEATAVAAPEFASRPLVAQAVAALARGDGERALGWTREALDVARASDDQVGSAEAWQVLAAVRLSSGAAPADAEAALREALVTWDRGGAWVAADRVRVALGGLPTATRTQRSAARIAEARLRDAGLALVGLLSAATGGARPAGVRIRVLGAFDVTVGGDPVPLPAWRSRQARTLLKILVARRGRPVGRGELCELLWPDDDPRRTGHRLSVLISAVRNVLDPERRRTADHFVAADRAGLLLRTDQVELDVEDFLHDAGRAADLAGAGDAEAARTVLAHLPRLYRGEAFEDEPYDDWAVTAREDLRAVWLRCLRLEASLSGRAGDIDHAVTCLVRILGADPYDEPAHRSLVTVLNRAGRHGEARRAWERWVAAMAEIGVAAPVLADDPTLAADGSPSPRDDRTDAAMTSIRQPADRPRTRAAVPLGADHRRREQ